MIAATPHQQKRHRLGFIPHPHRPPPRRLRDWWRFALVVVVLVSAGAAWTAREPIHRLTTCNDGWPSTESWSAGHRCIGLSSGPYAFDAPAFDHVMRVIAEQNAAATPQCTGTPVTVGVLLTMTDELAGNRAVHELEGMAAGQRRANGTACVHRMTLLVGQIGDYNGNGDPIAVAREMAGRKEVVAVAGIGLSHQLTAEVADILAAAKIPMVTDVVTAEGFDQDGSHVDSPDFRGCDDNVTFDRGVGKEYNYRVGYRVAVQVTAIGRVVPTRPDFIMVPIGGSDPYTCTALPFLHRMYGNDVLEVKFDAMEQTTVTQTAKRICAPARDVTIAYLARGRDLGRLLYSLDERYSQGQCTATSITVVSTSDGNRLRTTESDAGLEEMRAKAVSSRSFADGRVRLLFTLVAGADGPRQGNPNWTDFEDAFREAGFDTADIGDGWAVNAYDAVTTIDTALRSLDANRPVERSQVNTTISGFTSMDQAVPGAGGPIVFDNSGNRADSGPAVVRLCPATPGPSPQVRTVTAQPGAPIPDCPS